MAMNKFLGGLCWLSFPTFALLCVYLTAHTIISSFTVESTNLRLIYRLIITLYGVWLWWDWDTPFNGMITRSRRFINFIKPVLDAANSYFEGKVILDFSPEEIEKELGNHPIIFCSHPHGIFSASVINNFALRSTTILGDPITVATLNLHFYIPIWRDLCIAMGFSGVSRNSLNRLAKNNNAFIIVLGGAREALLSAPGRIDLIIKPRRGLFKLALQNGAAILPTINFGETELYDQIKWRPLRIAQEYLLNFFSFSMPIFWGKYGLLPDSRPLVTVVGKPVVIENPIQKPNETEIMELQGEYISSLRKLFHDYSHFSGHKSYNLTIR